MQRLWHIVRADLRQTLGQRRPVFDRLRGALSHEREHGVAGVAQEGHSAHGPARHRRSVKQGPQGDLADSLKNAADLRVPPGERGERGGDLTPVVPGLAGPGVLLDRRGEVDKPAVLHVVMDEMFAGSDSDLRRVDALVGADGIHSTVRGIIFGPENRPSHAK